jgi:hypothetical protein
MRTRDTKGQKDPQNTLAVATEWQRENDGGMKVLGVCRLVDVLGEWGSHKTESRLGRAVIDVLDAVEFAVTYYSPLVSIPRRCWGKRAEWRWC